MLVISDAQIVDQPRDNVEDHVGDNEEEIEFALQRTQEEHGELSNSLGGVQVGGAMAVEENEVSEVYPVP